jgi:hypothetical protein
MNNDNLNIPEINLENLNEINLENLDEIVYNISLFNGNINIMNTIENILNDLRNTTQFIDINNTNEDTVQFDIEFEIITSPETVLNYFKNCKEINEKVTKSEKIKKNDVLLTENCLICIENYTQGQFKRCLPKCKHIFHKKCIDKWLKKNASCPVCRDVLL